MNFLEDLKSVLFPNDQVFFKYNGREYNLEIINQPKAIRMYQEMELLMKPRSNIASMLKPKKRSFHGCCEIGGKYWEHVYLQFYLYTLYIYQLKLY